MLWARGGDSLKLDNIFVHMQCFTFPGEKLDNIFVHMQCFTFPGEKLDNIFVHMQCFTFPGEKLLYISEVDIYA